MISIRGITYQISGKNAPCYLSKNNDTGEIDFRQDFEQFNWTEIETNTYMEALQIVRDYYLKKDPMDDRNFILDLTDDDVYVFCVHSCPELKNTGGRTSIRLKGREND